jgi:hypothetical protein
MELNWATEEVAALLALKESGEHRMELLSPRLVMPREAAQTLRAATPALWFPRAHAPQEAMAGLWLFFGAFEEAHEIVQNLETAEGSYWHAIIHRMEPDAWNSGYWFRRVGPHKIFPELLEEARQTVTAGCNGGFDPGGSWNPERFTAFCEVARDRPASGAERAAREIQSAEWKLLFAWCGTRR